jgi:hypothetical protein
MTRRSKTLLAASLAALMLLGSAAAAIAAPMLSLSATRTVVTYPQPTWLKINAADEGAAVPTTVTVQYLPVGATEWKTLRTVAASRTAEGTVTVPVSPYRLRKTTAFKAVAEGLESEVVTVSVKARLSAPVVPAKVKAGRHVTVKGLIWPRHAVGSRPVTVKFWKWENGDWVYKGAVHPRIVGKYDDRSKWQFTRHVHAHDKGKWRIQVSHEDADHVESTSRFTYVKVR